jgi:hypothetical protein
MQRPVPLARCQWHPAINSPLPLGEGQGVRAVESLHQRDLPSPLTPFPQAGEGNRTRPLHVSCPLLLLLLLAGCLGNPYRFGNQSLYPTGIETVYVPVFESSSFRRDLGERLTEAVVKEIERRTPYKVVSNPGADTILRGRIINETKRVLVQTRTGDPRESEINLQVQVSWLDQRGNPLRNGPPIPMPADLVNIGAANKLVPEVGQSVATSQQQSINRLAEQIVSLMEAPW